MIKIIISDDHPIIREGLKKVLSTQSDFEVIAETSNGLELLNVLDKQKCDIAVVDLNMPGMHSVDLINSIRTLHPKVKILIVSAYSQKELGLRLIKRGISGFVPKESAAYELVEAIRTILNGQKYITKEFANKLAFSIEEDENNLPHKKLSDREFQILCLIAEGKSVSDISKELSISKSTVNTYHTRICDKMNIHNNAELIRYALKNNLVE